MSIEHVTDHEEQGLALLIEQFRDKPRIEILVRALMAQVQEAEDALWDLSFKRALANAEATQLDALGEIVLLPRNGMDDDTYRAWIGAVHLISRSGGLPEQLLSILSALTPEGTSLRADEYYPAAFRIEVLESISDYLGQALAAIISKARAIGVNGALQWHSGTNVFRFSLDGAQELGSANGLGSGVWAALSTGAAVNSQPSLDFSVPSNSMYLGAI